MKTNFAEDENLRNLVLGLKIPLVVPLKPELQNQRMITQQGQFLSPGTIHESFEQNLSAVIGADVDEQLIKFVIPNSWRQGILLDLRSMNISAASLFPGLDGFARSLYTSFGSLGIGGPWVQKVVEKKQKYSFPLV